MSSRVVAEATVGITLTVVFAVAGAGVFQLAGGEAARVAFLSSGPRLIASTLWLTLIVWVVLVVVGNVRNRRRTAVRRLATNVLSAAACAVLTIVGWFSIALVVGGWGLFLVAISLISCAIFLAAAVLAMVLTHLVIFRQRDEAQALAFAVGSAEHP